MMEKFCFSDICSNIIIVNQVNKELQLCFQIEHAQQLAAGTPGRFGKQRVVASMQVTYDHYLECLFYYYIISETYMEKDMKCFFNREEYIAE